MARYPGQKDRLSRREAFDIFGKGAKLTRITVPPGVHGPKGVGKRSQYGRQLREKQKVKRIYGVLEKQFRRYVDAALNTKGNTGEKLISLLEKRLDNVVFRLGLAPSRPLARQLVSHRHVLVNGKKVNIPSYRVRVGETIGISLKASKISHVAAVLEDPNKKIPQWLNKKGALGLVAKEPTSDDVSEPISV